MHRWGPEKKEWYGKKRKGVNVFVFVICESKFGSGLPGTQDGPVKR